VSRVWRFDLPATMAHLKSLLQEFHEAPHRAALARARRDEDDLFMLLVYSEAMGVPSPVTWYTLELLPLMQDRFHEWHRRMGMDRSPLEHFRCC
jgi:hypothetical protein